MTGQAPDGLEVSLDWTPPADRQGRSASFRIEARFGLGAETGVIFGPSGAGKSTILRLIAGLLRPTAGRVRLGDRVLFDAEVGTSLPLRRRRVGLIFQDDLLFPHLDVAANIRFGLAGWSRPEADRRVAEVASLCAVGPLLRRIPGTLSGGERQRVGLARALAPRPLLLLCDEPVSALDLASRDAIVDRLRAARRAEGIPMLYVTHSPAEAMAIGDRLFLVSDGRLIDQGPPLDVLARSSELSFTGVTNHFEATVAAHGPSTGETSLALPGGPTLIVSAPPRPIGSKAMVRVRADEIVLARAPIGGLSARNVIAGTIVRVVRRRAEAEVVVRTGDLDWIVSIVGSATEALGLSIGVAVQMIIKARSCQVADDPGSDRGGSTP